MDNLSEVSGLTPSVMNGSSVPPPDAPRRHVPFAEVMSRRREERAARKRQQQAELASLQATPPSDLSPLDYIVFPDDARVFVFTDLLALANDSNQGLLLSQLIYWFVRPAGRHDKADELPRARALINGLPWVGKSYCELSQETGLSIPKVKRAVTGLRDSGYIETCRRSHRGPVKLHLRLTDRIYDLFENRDIRRLGVTVYAGVVRLAGSVNAGVVLSQILYWTGNDKNGRTRLRVYRSGFWWLAKSYDDMARETGLTPREVRTAVQRLRRQGVIHTHSFIFAGTRVLHLRVNPEALFDAWTVQDDRLHELCLGRARARVCADETRP